MSRSHYDAYRGDQWAVHDAQVARSEASMQYRMSQVAAERYAVNRAVHERRAARRVRSQRPVLVVADRQEATAPLIPVR
jgi:hypothetical protein